MQEYDSIHLSQDNLDENIKNCLCRFLPERKLLGEKLMAVEHIKDFEGERMVETYDIWMDILISLERE